jgi:hypothetical protein
VTNKGNYFLIWFGLVFFFFPVEEVTASSYIKNGFVYGFELMPAFRYM